MVRNTGGWEFTVDRTVENTGHGKHRGWVLTGTEDVVCACGEHLFALREVIGR